MPSTILKVDRLSLEATTGFIIKNFSFSIDKGEIVALTGRSGSGKTSIAMAILGMLSDGMRHSDGTITFVHEDGSAMILPDDMARWASLRGRYLGFIQQDVYGAFNPVLKIGKQILMLVNERINQEYIETIDLKEILSEVGISDSDRILNSYPHQLSGGELQRCLLAMSILIRPSLLIADEPTSAIDKINQIELLNVLSFIREKYKTAILIISHDQDVVKHLADREVELEHLPLPELINYQDENSISNTPVLEVSDLAYTHHFGGIVSGKGASVQRISFSLRAGKCIGIIGESGGGKSTIAQMLVGLLSPQLGNLMIAGRTIDFNLEKDIRFLRTRVQLVMQDGKGSLHPGKTIRTLLNEVVRFQARENGHVHPDPVKVLGEVGLSADVLDRKASNLSGGECLRISIARALLMDPEVLICDESTSGLDQSTRNEVINLLSDLIHHRRLALILIAHDGGVITKVADEILVVSDGQIVERGNTAELMQFSTHPIIKKIFSFDRL